MKRLAGWGALVVALATVVPVSAQETKSYSYSTESTVGEPQVLDSWMQPTVVRTTHSVDGDGQTTTKDEPLVLERRERVMVPTSRSESTVSVQARPAVTRSSSSSVHVAASSGVVHSRPRRVAYHPVYRPRRIAYRDTSRAVTTTQSSATQVEKREKTETTPIIYDRRDPALDLY